ncbi:hypothetical protein BYI23_D001880 (plasmid) [Burkholderia sp. YI23]|nr:hypothetical protein BYI23_D001880 [Burkholderia sp. YI23]
MSPAPRRPSPNRSPRRCPDPRPSRPRCRRPLAIPVSHRCRGRPRARGRPTTAYRPTVPSTATCPPANPPPRPSSPRSGRRAHTHRTTGCCKESPLSARTQNWRRPRRLRSR